MKNKTPLNINEVLFSAYTVAEKEALGDSLFLLDFDKRRDFLLDSDFAGVAVRLVFCNERLADAVPRGLRRSVEAVLVDATERCEVAVRTLRVAIAGDEYVRILYADFPQQELGFRSGHTYKLVVRDSGAGLTLGEFVFHTFGSDELGHPSGWYTVDSAGIRPDWEDNLYKTVDARNDGLYHARFCLSHNFGRLVPPILPEVEIRIHYADGRAPHVRFVEPRCADFDSNIYYAEIPFLTGSAPDGAHYAELLCMQYPLGGFVFATNAESAPGDWFGDGVAPLDEYSPQAAAERLADALPDAPLADVEDFDALLDSFIASETAELGSDGEDADEEDADTAAEEPADRPLLPSLDHLTGLSAVKEKLTVYERVVRFNRMRSAMNLPVASAPLHAMFLGSPGTGKTTVAKLMGAMLHRAGLLSKGHVVVRERATLLGRNYNSESENTLEAIEAAQGGILLIDEAYQLYQPDDPRDPGKFVIETLLTALADESRRDWMLVLAGYPDETRRLYEMNPGFRSRIPDSNVYVFDDFTEPELLEIAEKYFFRNMYTLAPDARRALAVRLNADYCARERNFGNARHVINLIQTEIIPAMAVRVTSSCDGADLTEIQPSDIPMPQARPAGPRRRVGFSV